MQDDIPYEKLAIQCGPRSTSYRQKDLNKHVGRKHLGITNKCELCNKRCSSQYSLLRHYQQIHQIDAIEFKVADNEELNYCKFCDRTYKYRKDLYKHIRLKHSATPISNGKVKTPTGGSDKKDKMLCHVCSEGFRTKFILTRHLKEMHGEVLPITSSGVCPLCDVDVKNGDNILAHLEKAHQVTVESEKLYFKSIEDFEQWREHICIDSLNHFAKARGVDNVKDGQRMYLNCHYSGKQRDRGSGIRQRNSDRICKRGKVCPARLVVTCTSEGVEVIYYKTHVGHSNDVKCLRLTRTEKEQIANLLLNDIPHQKIIEEMRKSMPPSRRGAVKMQDLYNIRRDFNIDCAKVIMRTHDLSLDISKDMVHSIQPNIWKVTSNNGEYTVVFSTKAKCQGCHLLCWVCDVCVHQFSCTCNDNLVKGGFCEHIHACARLQKLKVFIETNAEPANGEDHIYCITQEIVPEEQKVENSTDSRYKLSFLLNASLGIISALDHEGCEKALPIVKKCIDDIMLLKRKQIAVEIERSDHNYSRPTESE